MTAVRKPKILFVFGTRPEAIKLCPVVRRMRAHGGFDVRICVTAQHRKLLDQVLDLFSVHPDYDLAIMREAQTLSQSTSRIIAELEPVIQIEKPDLVLVQGDTTTTFCGALAAFYAGAQVGHVEAGLRTGDVRRPFPEEMNRVLVTRLATVHFAATDWAAANLLSEGVPQEAITVTGNSGVDAVLSIRDLLERGEIAPRDWPIDASKKLILVTAHRRESFGDGITRICEALFQLAQRPDVQLIYPVHPNPNIAGPVHARLGQEPNVVLIEPVDYVGFVDLMRRSYFLLSDSGGVQEEAPSLGKPVLLLRENTERPESIEAGTVSLVGTQVKTIVCTAEELLDDAVEYQRRAHIQNPYGDGHASERITATTAEHFGM
jgi:UDP-N-acetylglucosamine 2-epimerase (non-hydrolysing)